MRIFVDNREKTQAGLIGLVFEEFEFAQLPVGDYLIIDDDSGVLIERKSIKDLISSIHSNHLWEQLLKMLKCESLFDYKISRKILVIHGSFGDYLENFQDDRFKENIRFWSQIMGASLESIYIYGVPVIHAENDFAFISFLKTIANREVEGKNDKAPEQRWFYPYPITRRLPVKDRKRYVLASIPSIGINLADNLLQRFSSIEEIASASVEQLMEVEKIGEKKAKIIYEIFH